MIALVRGPVARTKAAEARRSPRRSAHTRAIAFRASVLERRINDGFARAKATEDRRILQRKKHFNNGPICGLLVPRKEHNNVHGQAA
jgi:hypothetical protein